MIVNQGMEICFLETYWYRWGRYEDLGGGRFVDSKGYEISLSGILKLISNIDIKVIGSIANAGHYLNVSYVYSELIPEGGEWHPLYGTSFETLRFEIKHIDKLISKLKKQ